MSPFSGTMLVASLALLGVSSPSRPAYAADPTVRECTLASNESVKLRSAHKLREARAELLVCVAASCPAEVREECSRQMDRLTAAIPTIVFEVKDATGHELSAVKVTMDGEVVADHLDGTALTLDPGSHTMTFETSGQPPVTQTILFHEGDKDRHVPVVIGTLPPQPSVSPAATSTAPRESSGRSRRLIGLVLGSVGVAGVAVGGVFGAMGFSSWSSATKACPTHDNCPANAVNDRSNAVTFSTVSDVGFIAGGVLVAGGLALFFTAPKDPSTTVGLRVVPGGVSLAGEF
jgi:hypothetical protein